MRVLVLLCVLLAAAFRLGTAETTKPVDGGAKHSSPACMTIRGRAHLYPADGNLRIWHVGTHHEFTPADKASWDRVDSWLEQGVTPEAMRHFVPEASIFLFGNFRICPTEPYRKGWVQKAKVLSISHRRYVPAKVIFKQHHAHHKTK